MATRDQYKKVMDELIGLDKAVKKDADHAKSSSDKTKKYVKFIKFSVAFFAIFAGFTDFESLSIIPIDDKHSINLIELLSILTSVLLIVDTIILNPDKKAERLSAVWTSLMILLHDRGLAFRDRQDEADDRKKGNEEIIDDNLYVKDLRELRKAYDETYVRITTALLNKEDPNAFSQYRLNK